MAGKMENNVGPHVSHYLAHGTLITQICLPPVDFAVSRSGSRRDRMDCRPATEQSSTKVTSYKSAGSGDYDSPFGDLRFDFNFSEISHGSILLAQAGKVCSFATRKLALHPSQEHSISSRGEHPYIQKPDQWPAGEFPDKYQVIFQSLEWL